MLIRKGDLVTFETPDGDQTGVATEGERPDGTVRIALKGQKFYVPRADDIKAKYPTREAWLEAAYAFCIAWEDKELEELQKKYSDFLDDEDYF